MTGGGSFTTNRSNRGKRDDNWGGNVNPGCSPTAGDGGDWNHRTKCSASIRRTGGARGVEISGPEGTASATIVPARAGGNFQQPKLLQGSMPTTPQQSGYRNVSGTVVLEAVVDRRGDGHQRHRAERTSTPGQHRQETKY